MEEGDMEALLREPLEIPLKCRSCRNVYHYTVRAGDQERSSGGGGPRQPR
jgi:hypothetical protein